MAPLAIVTSVPCGAQPTAEGVVVPAFESFYVEPQPGTARSAAEGYVRRAALKVLGEACPAEAAPPPAGCWAVLPFTSGSADFEIVRAGATLEPGAAWEKAYELRGQEGIVYAEPLFGANVEHWALQFVDRTGGGAPQESLGAQLGCEHAAEALQDSEWSLGPKGANAREAWQLLGRRWQEREGRAIEEPALLSGSGVLVGHPDTGYTKHPELWPGRLAAGMGRDFVHDDADATDDLEGGILSVIPGLREPGHGTKTASVIVSAPGRQLQGTEGFVTGIAPGARLLPIRSYRGVVLFNMSSLAKAINYATEQGADVISISLGGPFGSRALHKAIRSATDRGVIVLAAAGNVVPFVVHPARYPEVISVAGSNVGESEWKGSAHGTRVDIGAPGQSVWRAGTEMRDGALFFSNSPGCGTSFAVATAAGVAALWLDYRREDLVPYSGTAWMASLFRGILRTRGHRKPSTWPVRDYGPGIIDARKVLETPIPAPSVSGRPTESAGVVALEGIAVRPAELGCPPALHERVAGVLAGFDAESPSELRRRLVRLLRTTDEGLCQALADVGEEVAFHYALSRRVREAVDGRPVGGPSGSTLETSGPAPRAVLGAQLVSPRLRERLASP